MKQNKCNDGYFGTIYIPYDFTFAKAKIDKNCVNLYTEENTPLELENITFSICGKNFKIKDEKVVDLQPKTIECGTK